MDVARRLQPSDCCDRAAISLLKAKLCALCGLCGCFPLPDKKAVTSIDEQTPPPHTRRDGARVQRDAGARRRLHFTVHRLQLRRRFAELRGAEELRGTPDQ